MEFNAARRAGKTYGKGNRNVRVHDFFDYRANHDNTSDNPLTRAPPVSILNTMPSATSRDAIIPKKHSAQDSTMTSPSSNTSEKQMASELKRSLIQDPSLFDMKSSDDESSTDTSGSRASKRQRVTKPLGGRKPKVQVQSQPTVVNSDKKQQTNVLKGNTDKPRKDVRVNITARSKKSALPEPAKDLPSSLKISSRPRIQQQKPAKTIPVSRTTKSKDLSVPKDRDENTRLADQSVTDASEYLSDRSQHSATLRGVTPKRKRTSLEGDDSERSSPSHLSVTALKLDAVGLSPARISPDISSDGSNSRKPNRRRLIDRLDAPTKSTGHTSEDPMSDAPTASKQGRSLGTSKPKSKSSRSQSKNKQLQGSLPASEEPQVSQPTSNWTVKPRTTYAAQRSHLSDMVDELDSLSGPSSQRSTHEVMPQIPMSSLASQLELEEDESDDQAGVGKLKSIHELRQAGTNNRLDREVDAMLEDIDVTNHSSKALRLQALMKLVMKLQESTFLRHVAGSGRLQRLAALANQSTDLPTSILLVSAFLFLAKAENISLEALGRLFRATTDLAANMLVDDRSVSKIAKERKQNLSKATVKDLIEFEQTLADQSDLFTDQTQLCADLIALCCLEHTLRTIVKHGDTSARLSTSVYAQVLKVLQSQVQHFKRGDHDLVNLKKAETALSLLELCSVVVDDADLHVGDEEYEALGEDLTEILDKSDSLQESLERSVLRVVVSLSNNKPRMCQLLGHTGINKAIFNIIDNNFLNLARQAEQEQELDQKKLDSVVLALGCLLNFAECDPTLRVRLAQMSAGKDNPIEQLVAIFNSQASKVDEAMTNEQSQVSVAFGYLSMLLCTLSLDATIKTQITSLLQKKSFADLCAAAERFFSHLRTLEHMSADDTSITTFTARFSAILETIRASTG